MAYIKKQTIRIELVSAPGYWVDISTRVEWAAQKIFNSIEDGHLTERSDAILIHQITDWNLDNEAGDILPITEENIDLMDREDVTLILQKWGEAKTLVEAAEATEKKDSSSELSQPSKPSPATK